MKQTISLKAPGRAFNLPTVSISGATVRRGVFRNFFQKGVARIGNNYDICNVFHLNQATESPTASAAGIYFARVIRDIISSVPCGALMRPLPDSRWKTTGSGTFSVSGDKHNFVSF